MAAASLMVVLAVSGCGGGSDDEASDQPTTAESSSSASASASDSASESASESASSGSMDLATYADAAEKGIDAALGDSIKKLYESIEVNPVPPSGIEYVYTFKSAVDPQAGAAGLKKQAAVLKTSYKTQIKPEMESNGFADPTVKFTYLNPDGTEVWSLSLP